MLADSKNKQHVINVVLLILVLGFYIAASTAFIYNTWSISVKETGREAIELATAAEAGIQKSLVSRLTGEPGDIESPAYIEIRNSLTQFVRLDNNVRFAYIYTQRNGKIYFLADSEPADSKDYSPPGQEYTEATQEFFLPFQTGKTLLSGPTTDRWGTWMSALVPMRDIETGNVIAVLGVDYPAATWNDHAVIRTIQAGIVVLGVLLILVIFLLLIRRNRALKNEKIKLAEKDAQLRESEERFRTFYEQAPIGVAFCTSSGEIVDVNPMYEKIFGRTKDELRNLGWLEITHPDDINKDTDNFNKYRNGEIEKYTTEKRYVKPNGEIAWGSLTLFPLKSNNNLVSSNISMITDITERVLAEETLRESERSKGVLLSHLPGMAYRCNYDREWTMQFVSAGCFGLTGYAPENLLYNKDLSFNDLITPEYRELLRQEWERVLSRRLPFKFEYEIKTASGERKWVLEMGQGIYNENGEVEALEGIILDISDRKEIENSLRHMNEHDRWTGLYNRTYLENNLKNDAKMPTTLKRAVVSINLSAVQSLTTTYGFHYTQELIKKAAIALNLYSSDKRSLFNTFENRFVFYLKDYIDRNELVEFCETIASTLESIFAVERIGGGIGVIELNKDDEQDIDQLLKKLLITSEKAIEVSDIDFAIRFYDTEIELQIIREQEIKSELAEIATDLNDGGLFMQYQPILDLKSNQVSGFEALARINSDRLGLLSPAEFIPLAEETKLIIPIGKKVLRKSLRFLNSLKEHGYETINVSINVSAIQLLRNDFVSNLFESINEAGVNPENIGLEITESVFASNNDDINSIIGEIKDAGIHIAIDDFGTGYSSLSRERELNVNCLKIDKHFIDEIVEVSQDKAITGDIISMAHKLGHYVIAEGVEHETQKEYLKNKGCNKIQGYLIGEPLDEEAAIALLHKQINMNKICHSNDSSCKKAGQDYES